MLSKGFIFLVSTIRERIHSRMEFLLKEYGLDGISPSHGSILITLHQNGPLTMGEIAKLIDRDKSTLTVLITKLESLGYVTRHSDQGDQRVTRISLTKKAFSVRRKFMAISARLNQSMFNGFNESETETLRTLLVKLYNNL